MRAILRKHLIYIYGAPIRFPTDPEFTRGVMQTVLRLQNIKPCQRPARAPNMNGKVKGHNGLFKTILQKIDLHGRDSDPDEIVAKPFFLRNIFHGSRTLSASQIEMGCGPVSYEYHVTK